MVAFSSYPGEAFVLRPSPWLFSVEVLRSSQWLFPFEVLRSSQWLFPWEVLRSSPWVVSRGDSEDLSVANFSKRSSLLSFRCSISFHTKPYVIIANLLDCCPHFDP